MSFPYRFPDPDEVIAEQARLLRELSVAQRLDRLFALVDGGRSLQSTEQRQTHLRLKNDSESDWRRIHEELFASHGR